MPLGNDRKYGSVYVITFELGSLTQNVVCYDDQFVTQTIVLIIF